MAVVALVGVSWTESLFKGGPVLREYVRGAMHRAHYEILEEDRSYYGRFLDSRVCTPMRIPWSPVAKNSRKSWKNGCCSECLGASRFPR